MAKKGSRKSLGLFRRVYSPIQHLIEASRNVTRSAAKRTGRVADNVLGFGQNVGSSVVKHANMTVRNVLSRKSRKDRKDRKSRKDRKDRKSRKTRKNRK
jgi:hypothetical protein